MKKIFQRYILIPLLLIISSGACVVAWTGTSNLIAENGDILTTVKWNELVNYINNQNKSVINTDRDDNDINTTRYYGTEYDNGTWKIDRETGLWNAFNRDTATETTNPWQADYATAWTNRASLTY